MKVLSLFSGIGAYERALENLGYDYELVNYCEIDKYASKSYSILHNVSEDKNLHDVTQVSGIGIEADMITYSYPCTDISSAGKQKGFFDENGEKTRSGLVWDSLRIIGNVKPKVAISENVKPLFSKKFIDGFNATIRELDKLGYNSYYTVLNAKNFGVPQNRERAFIVSIRKDIDKGTFSFPAGFPLEKRLKDILEENVDEKFYLSEKTMQKARENGLLEKCYLQWDSSGKGYKSQNDRAYYEDGCMASLTSSNASGNKSQVLLNGDVKTVRIGNVYDDKKFTGGEFGGNLWSTEGLAPTCKTTAAASQQYVVEPQRVANIYGDFGTSYAGNIYDDNYISPALMTAQGGNRQPLVMANIYPSGGQNGNIYNTNGVSPTLTSGNTDTKGNSGIGSSNAPKINQNFRIRRLTPAECFKLMGFEYEDAYKLSANKISNTQLYKVAGNSVVVDVLRINKCGI